MQSEEPSTCLVNTLVDEVGRIELRRNSISFVSAMDKSIAVSLCATSHLTLEWIVKLSIRHRTRIEPNVDKVALTIHWLTFFVYQNDIVDIWTMKVYLIIVLLAVVARNEALILHRIALHNACRNSLLYFCIQFLKATNALLATVFVTPYWQWSTPETRTREVPIVQVLKPVAETTCTCRLWLPIDSLIQFYHTLLACSIFDKPAVQWIIKDWLISTPAVRIVVNVLLALESLAFLLQLVAEHDIQVFSLIRSLLVPNTINIKLWVVSILHIVACVV